MLLILDIFPNNFLIYVAHGFGKIAVSPETVSSEELFKFWKL